MRPTVESLYKFYKTPLGKFTAQKINAALKSSFLKLSSLKKDGPFFAVGYPCPFAIGERQKRLLWAAPHDQGMYRWPETGRSQSLMVHADALPFRDQNLSHLFMVHFLEFTHHPKEHLREAWRVLEGEGILTLVLPNRLSFWSQIDVSPFGEGHPYSLTQITDLLEEACFEVEDATETLFGWPHLRDQRPTFLSRSFGYLCEKLLGRGGGVLIVQARKRMLAPTGLLKARSFAPQLRVARREPF